MFLSHSEQQRYSLCVLRIQKTPLSTDGKILFSLSPLCRPSPQPPICKRECLFVYSYNWFIAAAGSLFSRFPLRNMERGQIILLLCLPLSIIWDTRSDASAETTRLWLIDTCMYSYGPLHVLCVPVFFRLYMHNHEGLVRYVCFLAVHLNHFYSIFMVLPGLIPALRW